MFFSLIQGKPDNKDEFTNAMLAKIRHLVAWISFSDSLHALMFNISARFSAILENHYGYENYLKKSFYWRWSHFSIFFGLEMAKDQRCLCRSQNPSVQAPVNF